MPEIDGGVSAEALVEMRDGDGGEGRGRLTRLIGWEERRSKQ